MHANRHNADKHVVDIQYQDTTARTAWEVLLDGEGWSGGERETLTMLHRYAAGELAFEVPGTDGVTVSQAWITRLEELGRLRLSQPRELGRRYRITLT